MSDERFRALATDPRYRLPSRKQAQTAVDTRFKRLFTDDAFQKKANVDRYGRKVEEQNQKNDVRRHFRLEEQDTPDAKNETKVRLEDESSSGETSGENDDQLDSTIRDAAREGFSGSSSEEESTSEEEDSEDELDLADDTAGYEQDQEVPVGDVTRRLAVVNLDWDHIRAADILAVAQSFAMSASSVLSTTIYPSEFGAERMAKEELEGPPRAIFASSKRQDLLDLDEDDEDEAEERIRKRLIANQAADGEEFDTAKLRQYQLDRLRYYYAVIVCDNETTAKTLYDNMDGREYLTTANFFDLRFVPEETTFDAEPREACKKLPEGYKPNEFQTEALTHSKVKLTWDEDDTTRKEVQKRAFSRAEMDENDLRAYIGSESSGDDSAGSQKSTAAGRKQQKKEAAKAKMRALLGLPETASKRATTSKDEPVGDMQISFSAGLSTKRPEKGVFENQPQDDASTLERYVQKQRDRKQKRKERARTAREEADGDVGVSSDEDANNRQDATDGADPFDDPFFNDPVASGKLEKAAKQAERQKKYDAKKAADQAAKGRRAELELVMAGDEDVSHFDMRDIEKAQKQARKKKGKKQKGQSQGDAVTDDFKMQTKDSRFSKLFESHEYAIDPTNPRFKATPGMQDLLEEGRKKRRARDEPLEETQQSFKKAKKQSVDVANSAKDVSGLVARLKSKNKR